MRKEAISRARVGQPLSPANRAAGAAWADRYGPGSEFSKIKKWGDRSFRIADQTMESVFLLWHAHEVPDQEDDEKLIGVYRTEADAQDANQRLKEKSGFCETPAGFVVDRCGLNLDHWTEGYRTICAETRR